MSQPASPLIRHVATLLLAMLAALAMLSADLAAQLGITILRMPLFIAVAGVLVALGLAVRPFADAPSTRAPAVLLLLGAAVAVIDLQGPLDPIDYKLLLPVIVLGAAGPIAAALGSLDLPRLLWRLLTLYVLATAAIVLTSGPAELARGADGIARIDASGSLVMHAALCTLYLLLGVAIWHRSGMVERIAGPVVGLLALGMLLAAATRTPFIMLAILAAMMVVTVADPLRWLRRMLLATMAGLVVFVMHTTLVDPSLWRRFWSEGQSEWSTGRMVAMSSWLERAADHPLGLGLGAVRDVLAEDKPALDGEAILDWPHNEAVRLWVEAGPFGLAFLLVLLGSITARALALGRAHPDGAARMLALALAADAIAQSLVQNWLNSVYHATFGVLVIGLLGHLPPIAIGQR